MQIRHSPVRIRAAPLLLSPSRATDQSSRASLLRALLYEGRYEEAIAALEEATDLASTVGLMWNNLGMAYEHVDRIEEARSAYKQAMGLQHGGATQNFVRIEGVHSLRRTARADIPQDMPLIDDEH